MNIDVFAVAAANVSKDCIDGLCVAIYNQRFYDTVERRGFWESQLRTRAAPWALVAAHLEKTDADAYRALSTVVNVRGSAFGYYGTAFDVEHIIHYASKQVESETHVHQICGYLDKMNDELVKAGFVI